ncbi:MAG: hypothetical protein ACRC2U_10580 [Aeromonas sp.]
MAKTATTATPPTEPLVTLAEHQAQQPLTTLNGGKIAIIWDPKRVRHVGKVSEDAINIRPFSFDWVVKEDLDRIIAKRRQAEQEFREQQLNLQLPAFKNVRLEPGLNWIDADLWAEAEAESASRTTTVVRKIGGVPEYDLIATYKKDGAIEVLDRLHNANSGTIADYAPPEQCRIIDQIKDVNELLKIGEKPHVATVTDHLSKRLAHLTGRF